MSCHLSYKRKNLVTTSFILCPFQRRLTPEIMMFSFPGLLAWRKHRAYLSITVILQWWKYAVLSRKPCDCGCGWKRTNCRSRNYYGESELLFYESQFKSNIFFKKGNNQNHSMIGLSDSLSTCFTLGKWAIF